MSKGTLTPNFEVFYKCLVFEQDKLLSSSQIVVDKAHLVHGKKNPYKIPEKDTKPNVLSTSTKVYNNFNVSTTQKKEWKPYKDCEKTNLAKRIVLRGVMRLLNLRRRPFKNNKLLSLLILLNQININLIKWNGTWIKVLIITSLEMLPYLLLMTKKIIWLNFFYYQ